MAETSDRERTQAAPPAPGGRAVPAPRTEASVPRGNGRPGGPDAMRNEIERTRARMSRTLDEIEDELLWQKHELIRKKDEIVAKATLQGVRRKVSSEPWRSIAIAFVAGYVVAAIRD